jgi:predicted RNase H-like HicB family nuclease
VKIKAIAHEAEEGGYLAEVPALLSCMTQGETKTTHDITSNGDKRFL